MDVSGTSLVKESLIIRARSCVGVSVYRRKAKIEEAPLVVNCFRFTQWLWNPLGILLPDHQLVWSRAISIPLAEVEIADLVFVPRQGHEQDDFGHVGVATGNNTIIHATQWEKGVVEDTLSSFIARGCLGVRRILL